ncbi:MAG TPA: hypothetical protein PK735_13600 [Flavobacteriales bacterium]|nr:hypothetical protein [Flavobacteriales bacterium]
MIEYKDFATQVRTMRQHQKRRETSSAKLILQQCAALELKVDGMLRELFQEQEKEVKHPIIKLL